MSEPNNESATGSVTAEYQNRVRKGEIEHDDAQAIVAGSFDLLAHELESNQNDQTGISGFFLRGFNGGTPRISTTRGLYVFGGVGRGKTMLMDIFFEVALTQPRRRSHFHEFMAEIHDRISKSRKRHEGDPIPVVANEIARGAKLLCFDELHVTDIADAMILSRLFDALFNKGVVVVATSNAHPDDLYKDGLNRPLFTPFIALVHEHMHVHELSAAKDFRLDKLAGRRLYFTPADSAARRELDSHWHRLTGDHKASPIDLDVKGRKVHVPLASMGVARFSFADLCATALGSLDYLRIAHEFHTVLVDNIPQLTAANRNEARRFITLIDTLYDCKVSLIASADVEPDQLYNSGDGANLFERTASRLSEMRTEAYLATRAQCQTADANAAL